MKNLSRFNEMGECPDTVNIGTIISRMLDGLAFRYYWATEGLNESDLSYTPGNGGRTLYQTLNHIYNMVDFVGNIIAGHVSQFPEIDHGLTFSTLRGNTLNRIEEIKDQCLELPDNVLKERGIKGESDGNPFEMPILYFFNGPLPETFYHLGQIVSFRRTLGNPIDQHVNPLFGKRMDPQASQES